MITNEKEINQIKQSILDINTLFKNMGIKDSGLITIQTLLGSFNYKDAFPLDTKQQFIEHIKNNFNLDKEKSFLLDKLSSYYFDLVNIIYDKKLSPEESLNYKFEVVKGALSSSSNINNLSTPDRLMDKLIDPMLLSINKKILVPDVRSGNLLFNILYRLIKKHPDETKKVLPNITAYTLSSEQKEFIKLVSLFLFDEEVEINDEDFINSGISKSFDVGICNPPFGKSFLEIENKQNYELAYTWRKDKGKWKQGNLSNNPPCELLFLEKMFLNLSANGNIVIILPNSILENGIHEYARFWIKQNFKIEHIISLYSGAFKPYTSIKTCILKLTKVSNIEDYSIKMSVIDNENELAQESSNHFQILSTEIDTINFTPEYYKRKENPFIQLIENQVTTTIGDMATIIKDKAPILKDSYKIIRYIDISSTDALTGEIIETKEIIAKDAPSRAYYQVKTGDIITAISGGSLGTKSHSSVVITEEHAGCICSNGFKVMQFKKNVNPYYIWYFLRSNYYLEQVKQVATGSTILNIKEEDFKNIKLYLPPIEIQNQIEIKVKENIKKLKEAQRFLTSNEEFLKSILERRAFNEADN